MTAPGDVLDRIAAANPVEVSALPPSGAPDATALRARAGTPAPRQRLRAVSVALSGAALAGAIVVFALALPRGADTTAGTTPVPTAPSGPSAKIAPPREAPAFDLELLRPGTGANALAGGRFTNASLIGRRTIVAFWASWCGPCRQDLPELRRLADTAGPGTTVVIVATRDLTEKADDALGAGGFAVALDPEGAALEAFRSGGVPATYLIDPRGRVLWSVLGPGLAGIEATLQTTPLP